MRFGTFHPAEAPEDLSLGEASAAGLRQVEFAEQFGFDSVRLAKHYFTSYRVVNDARGFASHVAAATSTVRTGTAVREVRCSIVQFVTEVAPAFTGVTSIAREGSRG